LLPAGIALATMLGWELQEPGVTDDLVLPTAALVEVPIGLLWLRCAVRGCVAGIEVHRLLGPVPPDAGRPSIVLAALAVLAASIVIGAAYGDYVLRAMPFISA
jgi:hypothetical protein